MRNEDRTHTLAADLAVAFNALAEAEAQHLRERTELSRRVLAEARRLFEQLEAEASAVLESGGYQ